MGKVRVDRKCYDLFSSINLNVPTFPNPQKLFVEIQFEVMKGGRKVRNVGMSVIPSISPQINLKILHRLKNAVETAPVLEVVVTVLEMVAAVPLKRNLLGVLEMGLRMVRLEVVEYCPIAVINKRKYENNG